MACRRLHCRTAHLGPAKNKSAIRVMDPSQVNLTTASRESHIWRHWWPIRARPGQTLERHRAPTTLVAPRYVRALRLSCHKDQAPELLSSIARHLSSGFLRIASGHLPAPGCASMTFFKPSDVSARERLTAAWTRASTILLLCSASRARVAMRCWLRFCSVMFLAVLDAPTILPSPFLTGETVSETTIRLPSLHRRRSDWSTNYNRHSGRSTKRRTRNSNAYWAP